MLRAGLEPLTSGDPPTSTSQSAGITGVSHHALPTLVYIMKGKSKGFMQEPRGPSKGLSSSDTIEFVVRSCCTQTHCRWVWKLVQSPCKAIRQEALLLDPPTPSDIAVLL